MMIERIIPQPNFPRKEDKTMIADKIRFLALSLFLITALNSVTQAYWPTTVEQNLPVSAQPDTMEIECKALSYPNGGSLVILRKGGYGNVFQIIDCYGQLKYLQPQCLTPGNPSYWVTEPHLIQDGQGGAFIAWQAYETNPLQGIVAQRLDSLGNILWGDSGKVISPFESYDFDISTDGQGGFFLAISPDETADWTDLYIQRIDGNGNIMWGPQGVLVAGTQNQESEEPKITHGLSGDAFVIWDDNRPPYVAYGALYAQRYSADGRRVWNNDLYICQHSWGHKVIPDEQGGFILQANPGPADYNTHWRIGPNGNIIWQRDHLSWLYWSDMVPGEPGFFYLGFAYDYGTYGQRVRISDGMNMWPTWGSGQPGALMAYQTGWQHGSHERFTYRYPYFYGVFDYNVNFGYPNNFGSSPI
jgi:hypothetical protein